MPVWKIGTCCCCRRELVRVTFMVGYLDGKIYTGWVCGDCMSALRRIPEILKKGKTP